MATPARSFIAACAAIAMFAAAGAARAQTRAAPERTPAEIAKSIKAVPAAPKNATTTEPTKSYQPESESVARSKCAYRVTERLIKACMAKRRWAEK